MTYVSEQTSEELRQHMRSLRAMKGWNDPLSDRLWGEVQTLDRQNAELIARIRELEGKLPCSPEQAIAAWNRRADTGKSAEAWISVEDRLPEVGVGVMVYAPPTEHDWPGSINISFDCIDPDADEPTSWANHNEHYEHFCCVAKPEGAIGPSEKAPYTHWMPLPTAPSAGRAAPEGGKEGGE